ncbi:MAG: type II toxin-antitoxin system HicB family antitoxin [Syntrophorhabdales bacterium]|jgi:predicted HicB family RNase H-like nuclease
MTYKGYSAKVEFDDEARIFHGEVIGIRDVVTFQGLTVDELEKAFHDSVDDYLDMCGSRGEEPEKPFSGKFVVRVSPDVHRKIYVAAKRTGQSINAWLGTVLQELPEEGHKVSKAKRTEKMPEAQRLVDKLLKLKQEINSLGHNHPLLYVQLGFVEKMELDSLHGIGTFSPYVTTLHTLVDKCLSKYDDYGSFTELKNTYSEAIIFSKLNSVLNIEKVLESSSKSPDFKTTFESNTIYIEMKSLNMADGPLKHKNIMESAFEGKARLEAKLAEARKAQKTQGNIIVSDARVDEPYLSSGKPYDPSSRKLVVETLIDKIRQNIKKEQFSLGDTVLLIDFSDQLPLPEKPEQSLQERYVGEYWDNTEVFENAQNLSMTDHMKYLSSVEAELKRKRYIWQAKGCLWHVLFGEMGTNLVEPEDPSEVLEKQGILKEYDFVKGVMFHIDGGFYACMRDVQPTTIFNLFTYLSHIDFVRNKSFCKLES